MTEQLIEEQPEQVFKIDGKNLIGQLIIGFVCILAGLLVFLPMIGFGFLLFVLYLLNCKQENVRFYKDRSEVKMSLVQSVWVIDNQSIKSAEVSKNILILLIEGGENDVTRKIPIRLFRTEDQEKIIGHFTQLVEARRSLGADS